MLSVYAEVLPNLKYNLNALVLFSFGKAFGRGKSKEKKNARFTFSGVGADGAGCRRKRVVASRGFLQPRQSADRVAHRPSGRGRARVCAEAGAGPSRHLRTRVDQGNKPGFRTRGDGFER